MDWESLLTQPEGQHFPVLCLDQFMDKVSTALFRTPVSKVEASNLGGACSGFICKNSKGEMLQGRNYDGDYGEMVVVFNRNVKPGEHKSVMMTDPNVVQALAGLGSEYAGDKVLLEPGKEINVMLRQPFMALDGMNDAGLVISCYQLPDFHTDQEEPYEPGCTPRPEPILQETGKRQTGFFGLHYLALTKCATVDEVVELFNSYDFVALAKDINLHWCVSDGNKWLTLEYWRDETGDDVLYVFDENDRVQSARIGCRYVAYEYLSMENYYYNPIPSATWQKDFWQHEYGVPVRVHNLMGHYSPTMDEEEALQALQYGNYGIGVPGQVTNWSCVYNSKQRTILFNVRNQSDRAFFIDLKKDL